MSICETATRQPPTCDGAQKRLTGKFSLLINFHTHKADCCQLLSPTVRDLVTFRCLIRVGSIQNASTLEQIPKAFSQLAYVDAADAICCRCARGAEAFPTRMPGWNIQNLLRLTCRSSTVLEKIRPVTAGTHTGPNLKSWRETSFVHRNIRVRTECVCVCVYVS